MPELMTVEELGPDLRFTKKTVYKLLKQGSIRAIRIGNKWRIDKEVIDKWLQDKIEGVKARVLVVDDNKLIKSLFKKTLEEQGHIVVTASTSAKGVQHVKQLDFDLVFLDLKMPGMDGSELFRQIKTIKPKLPVTIITGYPESDMMTRALAQGPFGVMNKPFGESEIVSAVALFLRIGKAK